jgi:transcriptional regulator with XRE-family HTH domain
MKNLATFGTWLYNQRKRKGYSQDKLADISKISKPTISRIENGLIPNPKLSTLEKLARGLELPIEEVLKAYDSSTAINVETIEDKKLLDTFHQLSNENKSLLLSITKTMLMEQEQQGKKR